MHSSLGDGVRLHLKKKKKRKNDIVNLRAISKPLSGPFSLNINIRKEEEVDWSEDKDDCLILIFLLQVCFGRYLAY